MCRICIFHARLSAFLLVSFFFWFAISLKNDINADIAIFDHNELIVLYSNMYLHMAFAYEHWKLIFFYN